MFSIFKRCSGFLSALRPRCAGLAAAAMLALIAIRPLAGDIIVPNGSFESPETSYADPRLDSWQKLPKPFWYDESGGHPWDQLIGVFKNTEPGSPDHIGNCDGRQALFLFSLPQVGIYQDYDATAGTNSSPAQALDARYEAGRAYRVALGVIGGGGGMPEGATLEASLYYRGGDGLMATVAKTTITNSPARFPSNTNFVDFELLTPVVHANDPWVGRHIGIMLVSTVNSDLIGGYWDLDHIRLASFAAAPAPLAYERTSEGLKISWQSQAGGKYQVESSADLATWLAEAAPVAGSGEMLSILIPLSAAGEERRFYRILSISGL